MVPPMKAPIGMVPQMIVRTVAFMRPCTRSGVMACRRLTWVMLYTGLTQLPMKKDTISNGIAKPYWASGTRISESPPAVMLTNRVGPTPMRAAPNDAGTQVQEAVRKDQVNGEHHVSAEVRRRGAAGDARDGPVAEHESDPLRHLGEEA